jgi:hypothetical protein
MAFPYGKWYLFPHEEDTEESYEHKKFPNMEYWK